MLHHCPIFPLVEWSHESFLLALFLLCSFILHMSCEGWARRGSFRKLEFQESGRKDLDGSQPWLYLRNTWRFRTNTMPSLPHFQDAGPIQGEVESLAGFKSCWCDSGVQPGLRTTGAARRPPFRRGDPESQRGKYQPWLQHRGGARLALDPRGSFRGHSSGR